MSALITAEIGLTSDAEQGQRRGPVAAGFAIFNEAVWGVGSTLVEAAIDFEEFVTRDSDGKIVEYDLRIGRCTSLFMQTVRKMGCDSWILSKGVMCLPEEIDCFSEEHAA